MTFTKFYDAQLVQGGRDAESHGILIYNVTTQVAWRVNDAWLQWMLDIYIPETLGTGCFFKHQFVRLLEADETEGPIYAVQYYAASKEEHGRFVAIYQAGLKKQENEKWGAALFSFSSLMQVVD